MELMEQYVKIVVFRMEDKDRKMAEKKVWLITGAGSGIGYALTEYLLKEGHCVSALTRNQASLEDKLCSYGKEDSLLCTEVNLASDDSVKAAVAKTLDTFKRIDIVVNNAGYEKMGYIEELDIEEIKEEFEINFYAPIRIMKLTLPIMRQQGKGHYVNISSICGTCYSYAGSVAYNTSKAAMDSLSKTLASEVENMGIYATSLICGQFRTNYFDSMQQSKTNLDAYENQRKQKMDSIFAMNHRQRGDVEKLCRVITGLSEMQTPPKELYVGMDAYSLGYNKALNILANLKRWETFSRNMDFDEGE